MRVAGQLFGVTVEGPVAADEIHRQERILRLRQQALGERMAELKDIFWSREGILQAVISLYLFRYPVGLVGGFVLHVLCRLDVHGAVVYV